MTQYSGSCLCGAVTYRADQLPVIVAQCHCRACRKLSGTGHTVGAMFAADQVHVTGRLNTYCYSSDSGSEVTKFTCAVCASPIFGRNSRNPDHLTLTLGTMDDAGGLEIAVVIFEQDKPHWDALGPDVAVFPAQPEWTPDP